ncbi:Myosin-2 heavy chain like [Actinidia chinensis var. chinensis]|uniref:Myosin-2 heavy chain like n=1 Tax=Actinidia chinensis var. chinensis TaxID=1590841 RepID=A0A2R6QFZ0_ACTCC|nr:Myosin-2 heavy chain like [Actinidia chinensis var. chinensis]
MRRMLGARDSWAGISKRFGLLQKRPFCTTNKPTTPSNNNGSSSSNNKSGSESIDGSLSTYDESYRQLDKLDFMTAAKILFTTPPKKKKFGFDFHLVQFFFACLPSLAVYLVAQYAHHEMRRMEAELEVKKKAEEAAKAKEKELNDSEDKETGSDTELLEVKVRLDKLEEALKEIVVESKKQPDSISTKNQEDGSKRKHVATDHSNTPSSSEASNSAAKDRDHLSKT